MAKNKDVSLKDVYNLVEKLRKEVGATYVTKGEFLPVKAIAYGIVGTASMTILVALLARVVMALAP